MKVQHSLLAIMLTCSMLVSCNLNEPTPEEFKQKALELATYLSDNYQVGDSVFFETETGETEGFVVYENDFVEHKISNEPDDGEEFKIIVSSYLIRTAFSSKNNNIRIELYCYIRDEDIIEEGSIWVSGPLSIEDLDNYIYDSNENNIHITLGDNCCTLSKNVGIVQVSGKGHTWTLKQ